MNLVFSPLLKLVIAVTVVLSLLGYIKVLRSDNEALQATVTQYKLVADNNANLANANSDLLQKQKQDYMTLFSQYQSLNKEIAVIDKKQLTKEKEVIRYVERLPEGFEKQCLNMPVPDSIGRLQNN